MHGLRSELVRLLGQDALREGVDDGFYLTDSTEMQGLRGRADAIVAPADVDAIRRLVEWCSLHKVPIIPRGGGSGFAGGAVPIDGGVVCSLECLRAIRQFHPEFWRLQTEAGVTTGRIHKLARENGLMYPPDPGASEVSQIGGNVACNAGGPHSFKYGVTRDWVTGLEVVVAGGELIRLGGPLRKDVAGYDLISLFAGSEGTLGIIVSAWLRLIPAPQAVNTVIAGYATPEMGIAAILRVYASGLTPATLEYFDDGCLLASRASFPWALPDKVRFLVVSEADGRPERIDSEMNELSEALAGNDLLIRRTRSSNEIRALEAWRNGISFAVSARRGGKMSEDIVVPLDQLGMTLMAIPEIASRFGLEGCSWGHAGDGNAHATFMIDAADPSQVDAASSAVEELFDFTRSVGGSVSGEHGLGWVKRGQFDKQFGATEAAMQRDLRRAIDPIGIFNPGKKIPERSLKPQD